MSASDKERYERALHDAEVRLWVEERELELLPADATEAVRAHLVDEVRRLSAIVNARRAELHERMGQHTTDHTGHPMRRIEINHNSHRHAQHGGRAPATGAAFETRMPEGATGGAGGQ